uniref:glutathione S-transferase D5-like n=1 Tax=Styela clava TaxID=7725 RepID=UPI001939BB19|nr:glutathione S-transferase D5-like [Styela clava]
MTLEFYYHPQSPFSQSVWMILNELNIDYKKTLIDLFREEQKSESYRDINPLKKVPAIVDGNLKLAESRAIALYLCNKYEPVTKKNKLYPIDEESVAKMNMAIFRNCDNVITVLKYMNGEAVYLGKAAGPLAELFPRVKAILTEMNESLSTSEYFWGEHLTLLDFFALNATCILSMAGFEDWHNYPNLERWMDTMEKLSYYEECYAKPLELNVQMFRGFCQKASAALSEQNNKED